MPKKQTTASRRSARLLNKTSDSMPSDAGMTQNAEGPLEENEEAGAPSQGEPEGKQDETAEELTNMDTSEKTTNETEDQEKKNAEERSKDDMGGSEDKELQPSEELPTLSDESNSGEDIVGADENEGSQDDELILHDKETDAGGWIPEHLDLLTEFLAGEDDTIVEKHKTALERYDKHRQSWMEKTPLRKDGEDNSEYVSFHADRDELHFNIGGEFYQVIEENRNMYCAHKMESAKKSTNVDIKGEVTNGLEKQIGIKATPFTVFLFTETLPLGYDEPASLRVNHRHVDQLAVIQGRKVAVNEELLQSGGAYDLIPYRYQITTSDSQETLPVESLTNFKFQYGKKEYRNVRGIIKSRIAAKVTDSDVDGLARFFGLDDISRNKGSYDWGKLLSVIVDYPALGSSVASLNDLCGRLKLPFRYKAMASVHDANRHFKEFFQTVTAIRFGAVEGGHRTWIICRAMLGYGPSENVPLLGRDRKELVSVSSTYCHPIAITIITPEKEFSNVLLQQLQEYSRNVQIQKKLIFKTSIQAMYQEIIREVQQIYDEAEEIKGNMSGLKNGMTKREFWKMEWQSAAAKCPYSIVMNRVKNVVIRKYLESETESPIKGKKDKMDKAEIEKVLIFANKDRLFGRNFPVVEQGLDEHILPRRKKFKNGMAMYETVVRNDSGLHVLLWMVLQLTPFQFGRDIFRRFLASDRKGIHNPDFLLYFVILPVNEIVKGMKKDFDNRKLFGGRRPNVPAAKMKLFFNAWYTALYLKILVEKGLDITFPKPQENERCILDQFIQSTTFGTVEPVNVDTGLPDDYSKRIAVPLQAAMICYADALCKNRAEKRPWFSTLEGRWISEDGVITEENQLDSLLKQSATPFIWYTKWIEKVLQGDIKPDHRAFSVAGSPRKKKSPEQSRGKRKQEEDNPKPIRKKKKTAEGAFGAFHGFFSKELDSLLGDLNKDWASNRETKKRVDNFLASLNEKGRKVSVSVWKNLVVTDGAITTENKSDEESEGGMIV